MSEELKAVVWELGQQLGAILTEIDFNSEWEVTNLQNDIANLLDLPIIKKWLKKKPSQKAIDHLYKED